MDILPQILVNGLIAGALYGLIALGLSLIYGVLKFMNFAHGEMAMLGAYFYYLFYIGMEWPLVASVAGTLALCALTGLLFDRMVFEPLRRESPWTLLVTSIGVGLMIKSSVLLFATGRTRNYQRDDATQAIFTLGDGAVVITQTQIILLLTTLGLLLGMAAFLKHSKTGKAMRAVSDNAQAAAILGIDVKRTIQTIFIVSTCLAGIAGILIGYEQNLSPSMGLSLSVMAFSSVILGGLGNAWGAVVGAFLLGFLQNLAVGIPWFGFTLPSLYKNAVAFAVLILFLTCRPRGLFGPSLEEEAGRK